MNNIIELQKLYEMKIHETVTYSHNAHIWRYCTRVPGGWIYESAMAKDTSYGSSSPACSSARAISQIFVPEDPKIAELFKNG